MLVGARRPLVAYNVVLDTGDVGVAREVAAVVRESGGGLPGVQALGLLLPRSGRVQVSMNLLDPDRTPLHAVVERVTPRPPRAACPSRAASWSGSSPSTCSSRRGWRASSFPGWTRRHVLERRLGLTW